MPRFREQRERLRDVCLERDWKERLDGRIGLFPKEAVSPLLALLPRPELRWQAAYGLGLAVAALAEENMEEARIVMRRLMWSLNEESGNLGWGVPEAMGCILSRSLSLADEYSRILISYGYETGREDNYLDHAPLRAGVYWAIGYLAMHNPAEARPALVHLTAALADPHPPVQAMAAFAHTALAGNAPPYGLETPGRKELWLNALAVLEAKARALTPEQAAFVQDYFDGQAIVRSRLGDLLDQAARAAHNLLESERDRLPDASP